MIKYIAYCRKSTDEKEKQVLSIDQQVSELKEFAQRENIEILEFLTEAQSAKIPGRPVFNALVKRIENGEISGIISWNPDRLARNSVDGGKIIYLLDLGKLQSLKFPTHWFENTPQGRFMLSIAFGQAKYYVDNLAQNVLRGLKYKVKQGIWPARAPWGYRNDRNTRGIVIYPPEANVIRGAFELYATGKYALIDIGKYFYENGIKNKVSGGYPNDSNLRRILMRPLYYGAMVFKGELYAGIHEPIVSKALFDQVQKMIIQRGWYHQYKSKRYDFAFTGLIKCSYCGCSITAENRPFYFPRTHHSVLYRYYHCTKKRLSCLQKGYTREEVLETQFREIVSSVSLSEVWANKMLEFLETDEKTEKQNATSELQKLNIVLGEIEQKLDRLLEAYLDMIVDTQHYKQKKNELMEKQSILKDKITQLKTGNLFWIERMKDFILCALECAKIARAENNGHLLSQMAKKVGSKYFLKDHQIEFSLLPPYEALAAGRGAASATRLSDRTLAFGQSKYYVDNLSENVKRGNRQKLRNGVWPSKAPYGYINNPKTRGIDIDPELSKVVKKSFQLFAEGGRSFVEISHFLHKFGIKKLDDEPVKVDQVKNMLANKFYLGIMNYAGEYYQGSHKIFISKKLFDGVQKQIEKIEKPRNKGHDFAFSGLAICGECGAAITAEQHVKKYKNGTGQTFIYYRCTKKLKPCNQKYISESHIEKQLREIVSDCGLHENWEPYFEKWITEAEDKDKLVAEVEEKQLDGQIQETEIKLNRLLDGYLDQVIEPEIYKQKKNELFDEKFKLEEKKSQISKNGTVWLEPMRELVNCALQAQKIARAKNNCHDLSIMAKKVGSNFFLMNRRLSANLNFAFAALSAEAPYVPQGKGAASAAPTPDSISFLVSAGGFEPPTTSLRGKCSTVELRALGAPSRN